MKFRGEYYFLSNMYPASIRVIIQDKEYEFTCSEAAFQACKCLSRISEFVGIDGFAAKKLSHQVQLRPDWNEKRELIMTNIVCAKFRQHPELMEKLIQTDCELIETNTWGDTYWGICNGVGQNKLGNILMTIRNEKKNMNKRDEYYAARCSEYNPDIR